MSNEIQKFIFHDAQVRVVLIGGEPTFCLADICKVLDIGNPSQIKARLNADGVISNEVIDSMGRKQLATFVNEQNLYKAIFQSRKKEAEEFVDWVTGEVLPAIRKTGGYMLAKTGETAEELMARAVIVAQDTIERQKTRLLEAGATIKKLAPAAEYTQKVLAADNLHPVNAIAVHLGLSAQKLNKFLEAQGWLYKQGRTWYPSATIRNKGYCDFHIVPYAYDIDGNVKTREHLKWTETGRQAVINLYREYTGALDFGA